MRNIIYRAAYPLEFPLNAAFAYENARVYAISDLSQLPDYIKPAEGDEMQDAGYGYLVVEILVAIKDFESVNDAAAHARPKLLVVLSILSLYCDWPFTPFMSPYGSRRLSDALCDVGETRFILGEEQEDFSGELQKFIAALNGANEGKKRLIYSLLDRWRKARFMQDQSEDSMEYDDEVVIAYFHVLELMGTEYYPALKTKVKAEVATYLQSVYRRLLLFEGEYLKSMVTGKTALTEQLITEDLPVAGKILYGLSELGISGTRLNYLVANLVKDRNSVAHGRAVYQDKIIFPVPPFFPNAKISDYTLDTLKILTAHVICRYAGSDRYAGQWKLQDSYLIPTPDEIKAFVNGGKYKGLSCADFAAGKIDGINAGSISWYMVDKKIGGGQALEIFKDYLLQVGDDEEQISQVVLAAALMADVAKGEQLAQCEHVLKTAAANRWHLFGNMRDILSFLEYHRLQAKHLEAMIGQGVLR